MKGSLSRPEKQQEQRFSKLAFAKNKIFNVRDNQKIIQMDDVLVAFEMYGANKNRVGKEVSSAPPMFMYT